MTNGESPPIAQTIIGGSGTIGHGFDIDVDEGADDSDATESDYDNLFDDLESFLSLDNTFGGAILNSERKFVVPSYQRYYSWDKSNHEALWREVEDLMGQLNDTGEGADIQLPPHEDDKKFNESYFGPIYIAEAKRTVDGEIEDIYEVIDGQQRLATLFIILNEIRKRLKTIEDTLRAKSIKDDTFDEDYHEGIEYLRKGIISSLLYNDSNNDGKSKYLHLELGRHDKEYFQILFEDTNKSILELLSNIKNGENPQWKRVDNILDSLAIETEDIEIGLDEIDTSLDMDDATIDDFLKKNLYFATQGSHNNIFDAKDKYGELLDQYLFGHMEFDEEDYKQRAITLINIAILLMVSFRIVECEFDESVDDSMKIDVFKSLNETGKPLSITSKIRARVVNRFNIGDEKVEKFEEVVEIFGDESDVIKQYIVDFILATEEDTLLNKDNVMSDLLEFFSLRENPSREYDTRLDEDAGDFIDNLRDHADKYKIIKDGGKIPLEHISDKEIRNECNNILSDLRGKQWRPFVLRMYIDLVSDSALVSEIFFRDMLRKVENLMMRNSFAASAATALDTTFIGACKDYNNRTVPDYDKIDVYDDLDDKDWAEADEFNDYTREIIESHLIRHSSWDAISGTDIVRNMHGTAWGNNKEVLQLLARRNMADIIERPGAVNKEYTLDLTSTDLEHIFPQTPKLNKDDNRSPDEIDNPVNWFNDFFKLYDEDSREFWHKINQKYRTIDKDDVDNEDYERLNNLAEPIVEDIGNQILLEERPNKSLRNTQFSLKILGYYLTRKEDLEIFGDMISDPSWLNFHIDELVHLTECIGLKLGEGEAKALLYDIENKFDGVSIEDINDICSVITLEVENKVDPNLFGNEYTSPSDLFAEFSLSESNYSSLHDNLANYEYDDDDEILVNDGNNMDITVPFDRMIEVILTRVISKFDVTSEVDSPNEECKYEEEYIISRSNKKWTWEKEIERKVEIVEELLERLTMKTIDGEFSELDTKYHNESIKKEFQFA
jgi:uncharacterized protein with ParB-like and HNH nuclease domain